MNVKLLLALGLFLGSCLLAREERPVGELHRQTPTWRYINYSFPQTTSNEPIFLLSSGEQWDQVSRGLRVDIMNIVQGFRFFKTNSITARLYRANGEIIEPLTAEQKLLNTPVSTSHASRLADGEWAPQVMAYFPWGTNSLEEAWVAISIASERYWLEIPYGFDRDPGDALHNSSSGGPPKFFPLTRPPTEHDHVLRWKNVEYDLGEIQNHWRLSLLQSNPFDANCEIVWYRDDSAVGKSIYLWDLHTPHTCLHIVGTDGSVINGFCTDIHLHEDGMRRSDIFRLGRNGSDSERGWGRIEINVDRRTYGVGVPSSLYKYVHGHAAIDGTK